MRPKLSRQQRVEVASIVTEVIVDRNDRAFEEPTKPIGRFYSSEESVALSERRGWDMVEDSHRGWRRVVSSPTPIRVVQFDTIRRLVDAGVVVVACGEKFLARADQQQARLRQNAS